MDGSPRKPLRTRKSTMLIWLLSALVGSLAPALPTIASPACLLIEQAPESSGSERDDAGSICLSQPSARRTEARPECSGNLALAESTKRSALPPANFGLAFKQFGEHQHRNGIGAPLRR
jgi:hypothetical protein